MVDLSLGRSALQDSFASLFGRIFAPWSIMPPVKWAETVRRLPDEHGATRPFSFSYAPYQREPYLEIFNSRNQEVAMMMASRLGKSEIVLNALGYVIHQRPQRIAVMWPVEGDGKLWVKDDLTGSLIEPTPELAALIGDDTGRRKSDNTLLFKRFAGGSMTILGSNAPGRLRRVKAPFVYGDEIDAIEQTSVESKDGSKKGKSEGDVLAILSKRASEFGRRSEVYCSYPSLKGHSRIETKLEGSDYRQWFVTCVICGGEPYVFDRETQLRYDQNHTETARLECPRCKNLLDDNQRYAMMMGGDPANPRYDLWKATREYRGKVGFQAGSLLWPHNHGDPDYLAKYPGGYLQELAEKALKVEQAENPEHSRMVFVNTEDAKTYARPCDAKPEHSKLFLRRSEYNPATMLPAGVLAVFFFCDVQKDRLELFIDGYGEKNQVWALDYQKINGSPLSPPTQGCWAELDRILTQTNYPHPSGKTVRITGGLVDCGNWPDNVYAFTRNKAARGIYASRGSSELCRPIIERRARREGNPPVKVWHLGTNMAKDIIYQRLEADNPNANGYQHFPALGQFSETYFKMLLAEDSEMKKARDGKWYRAFSCAQGVRNEALDGRVGTMAAERIHKPKYAKLALELRVEIGPDGKPVHVVDFEASAAAKAEEPVVATRPPRSFVTGGVSKAGPRRGGFVSGWRR